MRRVEGCGFRDPASVVVDGRVPAGVAVFADAGLIVEQLPVSHVLLPWAAVTDRGSRRPPAGSVDEWRDVRAAPVPVVSDALQRRHAVRADPAFGQSSQFHPVRAPAQGAGDIPALRFNRLQKPPRNLEPSNGFRQLSQRVEKWAHVDFVCDGSLVAHDSPTTALSAPSAVRS